MELSKAIVGRRTHRKYLNKKVSHEKLEKLIEYARFAPMGTNLQALKFAIIDDENLVKEVFSYTKWSGYHPENAPTEAEQPPSYIAMIGDKSLRSSGNFETDAGAAGTVICLCAEDMGLATCWLGAINREEITKLLKLDEKYDLLYLIAVGYSDQKAVAIDSDGDIKYFTDENDVLNVPKRTLKEILIKI